MNEKILVPSTTIWQSPKKTKAERQENYREYFIELTKTRNLVESLLKSKSATKDMRKEVIQKLNDLLRIYHYGGQVVMTQSVASLNSLDQIDVFDTLADFDDFSEYNDPYKEHDCASFKVENGETYIYKIDYFDLNLEMHSEDNTNPQVTTRVMTVMTVSDY